jgi:hypothetical protein
MNWIIEKLITLLPSKMLSSIQFFIGCELMARDRDYVEGMCRVDRSAA